MKELFIIDETSNASAKPKVLSKKLWPSDRARTGTKKISLEAKGKIDDKLLDEVANVLKVSPEAIKGFNEEAVFNNLSNTFNDYASLINCQFNPIDKWIEGLKENKGLYKRLLQAEREKVVLPEKRLAQKK